RKDGFRVDVDGKQRRVGVEVIPVQADEESPHFLVLFHEAAPAPAQTPRGRRGTAKPAVGRRGPAESARVQSLREELAESRQYLQSIIQDLEAANEELQSANEEILSSNEELQSTNEELDTAKEELQSTNEELNTVNDELHSRN